MNVVMRAAFEDEFTKIALIDRLVRLMFQDIPGTRRWSMRKRSPTELAAIEKGVGDFFARHEDPAIAAVTKRVLPWVPSDKGKKLVSAATEHVIRNPETMLMEALPGGTAIHAGWMGAKKGLRHLIDTRLPPR